MADGQEQLRIWQRRMWRRRWLCLGVTWAVCAFGWIVAILADQETAAGAGLVVLVLLAGAGAGIGVAALVAPPPPVFESVAELQRSFGLPVLGSVTDLTPRPWRRATRQIPFAIGWLGLIAAFAGLLIARAAGTVAGA
jgi:uncharacterized protein involved in exopolysaccharide biosynthesis